jgi:hypothetical protein
MIIVQETSPMCFTEHLMWTSNAEYYQTDADHHTVLLFCLHAYNVSNFFDQKVRQMTNNIIFKTQLVSFAQIEQVFKWLIQSQLSIDYICFNFILLLPFPSSLYPENVLIFNSTSIYVPMQQVIEIQKKTNEPWALPREFTV